MNMTVSIVIGILASLMSSLVYLAVMWQLRPKIGISSYVSHSLRDGGEHLYQMKFINRSYRSAVDIRIRLKRTRTSVVPDGIIFSSKQLHLSTDDVFELPGYHRKDKEAHYARRVSIWEDLDVVWADDTKQYLVLQIIAKDSLSGFSRVFTQRFHTKRRSIKEGSHVFGKSLDVE